MQWQRLFILILDHEKIDQNWKSMQERLEENDSCDDGMSLTLEEKLHKRPLTAVLHYYTVS